MNDAKHVCGICHANPARHSWKNSNNEEKSICDICRSIVAGGPSSYAYGYLCHVLGKSLSDIDDENTLGGERTRHAFLTVVGILLFLMEQRKELPMEDNKAGCWTLDFDNGLIENGEVVRFARENEVHFVKIWPLQNEDDGYVCPNVKILKYNVNGFEGKIQFSSNRELSEKMIGVPSLVDSRLRKLASNEDFEFPDIFVRICPRNLEDCKMENTIRFFKCALVVGECLGILGKGRLFDWAC